MSKSRAKRSKRRKPGEEPPAAPPPVEEPRTASAAPVVELGMPDLSGVELDLYALKLNILGPFLFRNQTLCEKALKAAQNSELLPRDTGLWPTFFDREHWDRVQIIATAIHTTIKLWQSEPLFKEHIKDTRKQSNSSLAEKVRRQGDGLLDCPKAEFEPIFKFIRRQFVYYESGPSRPGEALRRTVQDRAELVKTVRLRGNNNVSMGKCRAAIADYTQAVKLCPFIAVLYCNRAQSYMKTGNYWFACVDGLRAIVLQENWEKAYYRCAKAWSKLGDMSKALAINEKGRKMCQEKSDLEKQCRGFQTAQDGEMPTKKLSKPSRKNLTTKEKKPVAAKKTALQMSVEETGPKGVTPETTVGSTIDAGPVHDSNPFTDFKKREVPHIHPCVPTAVLKNMCNEVKMCTFISVMYTLHSAAWELYEPAERHTPQLTTNPDDIRLPMVTAHFDEIWCPIPADYKEAELLLPPSFCYVPTEKHSPSVPDYMILKAGIDNLI